MWLVIAGVILLVGKLLDLGPLGMISWWWVAAPFVAAFIWFEIFERRLGLDKKKAFDELDQAKKERIAAALQRDRSRGGSRR